MRRTDTDRVPRRRRCAFAQRAAERPPCALPRGFTLVEALVAIAILGVVALLAWRATEAMTGSEAKISG